MLRTLQLLSATLLAVVVAGSWTAETQAAPAQLQVFYTVHAHFNDKSGGQVMGDPDPWLNPEGARSAADGLDTLARTLEKHGARGSFHLTAQMAEAICAVAGRPDLVRDLVGRGHDIGAHGHGAAEIEAAAQSLRQSCSHSTTSASGILAPSKASLGRGGMGGARAGAGMGPPAGARGRPRPPGAGGGGPQAQSSGDEAVRVAEVARQVEVLGFRVVTMHATPYQSQSSRLFDACDGQLGSGDVYSKERGALPQPWRPDPSGGDPCGHHDGGDLVFLDHASGEWLRISPQSRATVDVASDREFDILRGHVDVALRTSAVRPEIWGFMSHLHEYMVGGREMDAMSPQALASLERFLEDVNTRGSGKLRWTTATRIAAGAP